jgi:hypothetical protein
MLVNRSGVTGTASWLAAARTVRGAAHRRRQIENQDAVGWAPAGSGICVAVADGHGSPASYRSAQGAAMAVQVALEILQDLAGLWPEYHSRAQQLAPAYVRTELIARWRRAVAQHWDANPESSCRSMPAAHPWTVYGSTILAVLATPAYLLCAQLGDGDILIVSGRGAVTRPWPKDPRLLGVETTSLAGRAAEDDVRVLLQPLSEDAPALLLLSTDGYANSFREEAGFLKIGEDLIGMIRERGLEAVERDLEGWLNETSELGSGDDIAIALLCRVDGDPGDGV